MNRKYLPLVLMLVAGGITCFFTFINDYSISAKVISLSIVLIAFFILGSVLRWTLDQFDKQNQKALEEKGEVIDKTEGDGTN